MQPYLPVFQDQVTLEIANGSFLVLAKNVADAEIRLDRWMKKLDMKDKQYFTGCKYPTLYDVEPYVTSEEGVVVMAH